MPSSEKTAEFEGRIDALVIVITTLAGVSIMADPAFADRFISHLRDSQRGMRQMNSHAAGIEMVDLICDLVGQMRDLERRQ